LQSCGEKGLFRDGDVMPRYLHAPFSRYSIALLSVAAATAIRLALDSLLGDRFPLVTFFLAVVFTARYGGFGPSLLALVLAWFSADQLLLQPPRALPFFGSKYQLAFAFFTIGLTVILLSEVGRVARRRARDSASQARQALESHRANRERLRITLASIGDAVITTDAERCVDSLNPVAEKLTGWRADEAMGRPLGEVFRTGYGMTDPAAEFPMAEVVRSGVITLPGDHRVLLARDGTSRCIDLNPAPIKDDRGQTTGVVIIFRDTSERRRVEEALRESEERFRTMTDAAPMMVWGSGTDKLCNYFNKQWLNFTGRTVEQEVGNGWSEGLHPDDLERCLNTYHTAFDARKPFLMEYRLRRHDGEYRWVMDTGVPRFAPDGTFSGYIGSCFDITERKRAEEELRSADRRKEEFLAVLSHELRNPLAPIQTALDLLEQAGACGDTRRELATIRRQVDNLKRLVDDLLDVSRISRGKIELRKEVVPLAEVVAHSVEAVRALVEEQHQGLHVSIPEESLLLDADPTRLEQILSNLMINAAKYTPHGGQIWLTAERTGGEAVLRVRDTGIGIEPEFLEKIFDLFVQGERRLGAYYNGVGIGLNLVKNLVELHGGTIAAHSQGPDKGSEFRVRLPVLSGVRPERKQSATAAQPKVSELLPRRSILIVDDNVQAADNLGMLMSKVFGQEVRVVYNGKSALEIAGSFCPDIILLDLEMAGMDGYEVAMRLRTDSECSRALIVAVTGWGQEEYRRRSRELGFDLHLVKPVTARDLRQMLVDLKPNIKDHSYPSNRRARNQTGFAL
jgi:two-component system CheB/CheR fusion protein